ncbi:hypothetical protein Tco_1174028 [Tanacetum coccineum]
MVSPLNTDNGEVVAETILIPYLLAELYEKIAMLIQVFPRCSTVGEDIAVSGREALGNPWLGTRSLVGILQYSQRADRDLPSLLNTPLSFRGRGCGEGDLFFLSLLNTLACGDGLRDTVSVPSSRKRGLRGLVPRMRAIVSTKIRAGSWCVSESLIGSGLQATWIPDLILEQEK